MNPRAYWRFVVVFWRFLPLLLSYARDRRRFLLFGGSRDVTAEQRRERAASLLESLLTLGPTYIKLGQLLSTRPDVLPPEYIAEFSKLQDQVPPAEWEGAKQVIEADIGPIEERFDEFDTEAISGASLGQVYFARIDGDPVAVKIRRPGVEKLVESDLRVIRWSVPILMRFVDDARSFSLETLADEFAKTIRQEMDYERERRMLREIRGNFAENSAVRMPAVIDSHSTPRVLTMEYVGGIKITDLKQLDKEGIDRSTIAETLQQTYLQMIIEDGVFHADPHPGNLAVQSDGTLVFYDFGMSGYVDPFIQDKVVDFYGAVAREDTDAILDTLIETGTLSPEADRELMSDIMELAIEDARGEDIDQYRVQQIVQQVEDTIYEFPLRLPSNLALVLRVATVVEGVCVTLDSEFDFIDVATTFLRDEGYIEAGAREFVTDRATEVRDAASSSVRIPPKLESTLDRIERDDLRVDADIADSSNHFDRLAKRVILGMLAAAGVVSSTLLYLFETTLTAGVATALTVAVFFLLYRSFTKQTSIRAQPQFTRYKMRQDSDEGDVQGYGDLDLEGDDGADSPAQEDSQTVAIDDGSANPHPQTIDVQGSDDATLNRRPDNEDTGNRGGSGRGSP